MSKMSITQYYFKNKKAVAYTFLLPLPLFFLIIYRDFNMINLALQVIMMGAFVSAMALFMATSQREFMARSFTFTLPGFRKGLFQQHVVTMGLCTFLISLVVLMQTAFGGIPEAGGARIVGAIGMCATLYALTALLVFQSPYASLLLQTVLSMVLFPATVILGRKIGHSGAVQFLEHPFIWLGGAAVMWWVLGWRLTRPGLHRHWTQEPFLSIGDIGNQQKFQAFKYARSRTPSRGSDDSRWGLGLIQWASAKSRDLRLARKNSRALVFEAVAIFLATTLPRSKFRFALTATLFSLAVPIVGYLDGIHVARGEETGMPGWFAVFGFFGMVSLTTVFHHVVCSPAGLLSSRADRLRAGWIVAGALLLVLPAGSSIIWGMFKLGVEFLPVWHRNGCDVAFALPPAHLVVLPLFYLPAQLLVGVLWPKRSALLVYQHSGHLTIFLFHGLLLYGDDLMKGITTGVAILLWLLAAVVWRWRVNQSALG